MDIQDFIAKHQLPDSYQELIQGFFIPLVSDIASQQKSGNNPIIVAINGAQGSGKSTLADLLVLLFNSQHSLNAVALSIDDFYFSQPHRAYLAKTVHPLMVTRGVPGTHDIALAISTVVSLIDYTGIVRTPKFNKAIDNPSPEHQYPLIKTPVDIVILEGWCLGATVQTDEELAEPVNDLERNEDTQAIWRHYVNGQLADEYQTLFNRIDKWIMLKAPSFDCVYQWRLEQENKLRDKNGDGESQIMNEESLKRFVMFYQRITEHVLKTLPAKVDYLFELDKNRIIQNKALP
ncbi:MAG: kinase [Methylophagaceae bacterium]